MVLYNFLRGLILPLKEIDKIVPNSGKIIDLGCGQGQIASFIAKKERRNVIGVDLNTSRLPKLKSNNLRFEHADIIKYPLHQVDVVILSDVLHHIDFRNQQIILSKIFKGLKRGGILVIKEIDTKQFVRSHLSRFWDFVFYPKDKIYFSNSKDMKQSLEKLGFKVSYSYMCQLFPGSTTLYICKKL